MEIQELVNMYKMLIVAVIVMQKKFSLREIQDR